jgi:hypothetical protein
MSYTHPTTCLIHHTFLVSLVFEEIIIWKLSGDSGAQKPEAPAVPLEKFGFVPKVLTRRNRKNFQRARIFH